MQKTETLPTWDLTKFYKGLDDPKIESDLKVSLDRAIEFEKKYRGKISNTIQDRKLLAALQELESIVIQAEKPSIFAFLNFSVDTNNPVTGALVQKTSRMFTEIYNHLLFFDLSLLKLSNKKLQRLQKSPTLENYSHFIEKLAKYKPHKLSEKEEKIFNDKALTSNEAFVRLFDQQAGGMKFDLAYQGETKSLNQSEILNLLQDPSRTKRKAAADGFSQGLIANAKNFTFISNNLSADKEIHDKYHKFKNPQTARHMSNEVDQQIVDTMIGAVEKNFSVVSNYYKFKKDMLKLKELFEYDRYAPLGSSTENYSYAEAKKIILESFRNFSPKFAEIAQKFFDNNWIHAQVLPGKQGGAYCHSATPDLHPLILTNYQGKIENVTTLAHELGHGINDWLMRKQTPLNYHVPLILAETASVFCEMIIYEELKKNITDKKQKLAFVMDRIERVFSSVFRQANMHMFEADFHAARSAKGELATEEINGIWLKRQNQMFKNSVTLRKEYGYWWSYIPHFLHSPFYVYAYAFGELLVFSLYAQYKKQGRQFVSKYIKFLEAGNSESPKELLAEFGMDMSDEKFWLGGIKLVSDMVAEAKKLSRQAKKK
jgi:oligoendopeptidase F